MDKNDIPVPTMSTQGWVTDPSSKIDMLLSHFFEADYNQTQLYPNTVSSIARIIQESDNDVDVAAFSIKEKLTSYLANYYDSVEVTTTVKSIDDSSAKMKIEIDIAIIYKGSRYGYTRLLQTDGSRLDQITKLNNY